MTTEAEFMLAKAVLTAINNNTLADNPAKFQWRVAPSKLGGPCVARNWYAFRWVARKQPPAFVCRMFEKGHKSEANTSTILRRAGWEVRDYKKRLILNKITNEYDKAEWDADYNIPGIPFEDVSQNALHIEECHKRNKWFLKQYKVVLFNGHLTGFLDAKVRHPEHTNNEWWLGEYKTYNTKRFSNLYAKGVKEADFDYYVQICIYMREHDLPKCLFVAQNKNDSDICVEVVNRDDVTVDAHMSRADAIINSRVRPARISETPAWHDCKSCDYLGPCHKKEPVEINCRSCTNCEPIEGGQFNCRVWGMTIPDEHAIMAACPRHSPVQ